MAPSAAEILEQTASTYANCASYRDTGEVVTVFIMGERSYQRRTTRRPFSTLFVRPNLLRFEYRDSAIGPESEWNRCVVWADGQRIRSWWTITPEVKESPSILEALSGPTGVSGGSAFRVPSLLLPGSNVHPPMPLPETASIREEVFDGMACYVVSGATRTARPVEIWLDTQAYLIRLVKCSTDHTPEHSRRLRGESRAAFQDSPKLSSEQRDKFLAALDRADQSQERDFRTETTTTYVPEVNVDIPADAFAFTPPE